MKSLAISIILLSSQFGLANIYHSGYEVRHLDAIESAIEKSCGAVGVLTQKSTQEELVVIDQGIRDIHYTTVIESYQRVDQNMFETVKIIVKSVLADMYDHSAQEWGEYHVESVQCNVD